MKLDFYEGLLLEKQISTNIKTREEKETFKRIYRSDIDNIDNIMDFCLDYIKDKIVHLNDNTQPLNGVLRELFLRGLAEYHIKNKLKIKEIEKRT